MTLFSNCNCNLFYVYRLGYRAKFLVGTTAIVRENRKDWLLNMRNRCREDVQNDLIALPGVGRKVADCVALFSMKQSDAVPIDTHVWDIVLRDYSSYIPIKQITSPAVGIIEASGSALSTPSKDTKTLTPHVYESIGAAFRSQFKSHAGWAHSVLFAGELPELRKLLPNEMQDEMLAFAANKAAKKKVLKLEKMDKGYKKDNEKDILISITVENSHDSKSAHTLCYTPPVKQKVKSCKKMASTPTL